MIEINKYQYDILCATANLCEEIANDNHNIADYEYVVNVCKDITAAINFLVNDKYTFCDDVNGEWDEDSDLDSEDETEDDELPF